MRDGINMFVTDIVRVFSRLVAVYSVLLLLSCSGGGSTGTGGRLFRGTVSDVDGVPLGGITVTIAETGDSGLSDDSGSYDIESSATESTVEYFFSGEGVEASFVLTDVPPDSVIVNVNFELDPETDQATPESIDIEDDGNDPSGSGSSSSAQDDDGDTSSDGDEDSSEPGDDASSDDNSSESSSEDSSDDEDSSQSESSDASSEDDEGSDSSESDSSEDDEDSSESESESSSDDDEADEPDEKDD